MKEMKHVAISIRSANLNIIYSTKTREIKQQPSAKTTNSSTMEQQHYCNDDILLSLGNKFQPRDYQKHQIQTAPTSVLLGCTHKHVREANLPLLGTTQESAGQNVYRSP
ncbi:unnamed protein product [Ectocarpus sp. 12 AP-2014]